MPTGKWNAEWNEKIEELGLKGSAKIQKGDPFRGVLKSGSTSKGTKAERKRAPRSDRFGATNKEWDICLEMKALREAGRTYGQIAQALNQRGIKTKAGKPWNYFTARFVTLRTVQMIVAEDERFRQYIATRT